MALGGARLQDTKPCFRSLPSRARQHLRPAGQALAQRPDRRGVVVEKDQILRTLKVLQLLDHRVGAPAAPQYVEDQTPASEFEKARQLNSRPAIFRPRGAGRPTKKDRRAIDLLGRPAPHSR
jgi:hypothetical protein